MTKLLLLSLTCMVASSGIYAFQDDDGKKDNIRRPLSGNHPFTQLLISKLLDDDHEDEDPFSALFSSMPSRGPGSSSSSRSGMELNDLLTIFAPAQSSQARSSNNNNNNTSVDNEAVIAQLNKYYPSTPFSSDHVIEYSHDEFTRKHHCSTALKNNQLDDQPSSAHTVKILRFGVKRLNDTQSPSLWAQRLETLVPAKTQAQKSPNVIQTPHGLFILMSSSESQVSSSFYAASENKPAELDNRAFYVFLEALFGEQQKTHAKTAATVIFGKQEEEKRETLFDVLHKEADAQDKETGTEDKEQDSSDKQGKALEYVYEQDPGSSSSGSNSGSEDESLS